MVDPTTLYLVSGLVGRVVQRAYWLAFAVRVAVRLDVSPLQLVLLGTAMELTILAMEVPTGVVADVVSRRLSVVIAHLVMGSAIVLSGLVASFPLLALSQVLWGLGYTFQSGAETAWFTDAVGSSEVAEPVIVRRARLQLLASVCAMIGGGALAQATSPSTTIVVAGVAGIAWGLVLVAVMPEVGFEPVVVDRFATARRLATDGARLTWRTPTLRLLLVVMVVVGTASEAVDRLDLRRLDQLGLSTGGREIVIASALACCDALVGAALLWGVAPRVRGAAVVRGTGLLLAGTAIAVVGLGLAPVLGLAALALVVQGGLRTAMEPLVTTWTNRGATPATRATVHSFIGQAEAVGEITGGVALGTLAQVTTVSTAFGASACLFVFAAALARLLDPGGRVVDIVD